MFERPSFRHFDKALFAAILVLLAIGLAAVYSATHPRSGAGMESYWVKQATWMAVGLVLFLITITISYQRFIDGSYVFYGLIVVSLVLVLVLGRARLGAQRWFSIGPFAFQPSEFIKIALILALAHYVGFHREGMGTFRNFCGALGLLAAPFLLVVIQPDLGTSLTLVPIFFSIMVMSGANLRYLGGLLGLGLLALPVFWHFLRDYQKMRLLVFINPNSDPLGAGYTIIQSKIAVGSGGLFGKGWLGGSQGQLNFLPEHHTDFIFSVVGEEFGFLGGLAVILLFFFIVHRAFRIAYLSNDPYGRAIAAGIAVLIAMQVVVNICMTIGLMPVVGIPLPLVSYGGSSMLATLVTLGLLLNVGMRRSPF